MSLLKENSSQTLTMDSLSLPPRLGRKRRSSILKPQRPFTDLQNLSRCDESRLHKDRRVSFCPTIEIKEFNKDRPAGPSGSKSSPVTRSSSRDGTVQQVSLPSPEGVQMSTPVKRKKRRISASQVDRFSIIPRLEKSFSYPDDDDFVIFEDGDVAMTAQQEEITLLEDLPEPQPGAMQSGDDIIGGVFADELNELGPPPKSSVSAPLPQPVEERLSSECTGQSPSPAPAMPTLTAEDTARLMELFPRAAVMPAAGAPTLLGTPLTSSHPHYLAMATPENLSGSPANTWHQSRSGLLDGSVITSNMELTGVDESDISPTSPPQGSDEPCSMSLTCVPDSSPPSSEMLHAVSGTDRESFPMSLTCLPISSPPSSEMLHAVSDEPCSMSLTCIPDSSPPSSKTSAAVSGTDRESLPMSLTCLPISSPPSSKMSAAVSGTDRESLPMSLTMCSDTSLPDRSTESNTTLAQASLPMSLTCIESSRADQSNRASSPPVVTTFTPASTTVQENSPMETMHAESHCTEENATGGDREEEHISTGLESQSVALDDGEMDLTCMADTTLQTSVTTTTISAATTTTEDAVQQSEAVLPTLEDAAVVIVASQPPASSPVFKQPGRRPRSHLKLKSSGRCVVKPSPVIRTPQTASNPLQLAHPGLSLTPSVLRTPKHACYSTFVVSPLCSAASANRTEKPTISTNTTTSAPLLPTPTHPSPPSQPSSPSTSGTTAQLQAASGSAAATEEEAAMSHSLLTSRPESSVMAAAPLERILTGSAWLQSPGDSFNLVNSGDDTLSAGSNTQESVSPPSGSPARQLNGDAGSPQPQQQSNNPHQMQHSTAWLGHKVSCEPPAPLALLRPHTAYSALTPAPSSQARVLATRISSQVNIAPTQPSELSGNLMAAALQQLKVCSAQAGPVSIETPESAVVDVPLVPNDSLHVSGLHMELNDTTMCYRSMLLSPSVYDKFVAQICSENTQQPTSSATDSVILSPPSTSLLSLLESPPAVGRVEQPPSPMATHQQVLASPLQELCKSPSTSPQASPSPASASPASPSPASASPTATAEVTSNILFSDFVSELTSRLRDMLQGVQQRLHCGEYVLAHQHLAPMLDNWSCVLSACLGTLTAIQQYGELSRASHTHSWSSEGVPVEMPLPPMGEEDMVEGLARKAEWIMELSASYNQLLPIAQVARDEAAMLYDWHFEEWTYDQHVEVEVQSQRLHFQILVSDVAADRTGCIAQAVWDIMQAVH